MDLLGGAPQIAPRDSRLDGDPAAAGFPLDGGRPRGLRNAGELAERDAGAAGPIYEERAEGVDVAALVILQADDEVETPLADPDLRDLLAGQPDPHGLDHLSGPEARPGGALAVHGDADLGQAGELLRPQVRDAFDGLHDLPGLPGDPGQPVEVGAEDPHLEVGRRAAQPL